MVEHRRARPSRTPTKHRLECWTPPPLPPLKQDTLTDMLQQNLQSPGNKGNRDECTLDLTGPEKDYWQGTEAGMLKVDDSGICAAGDGSSHDKTKTKSMGADFCTLRNYDRANETAAAQN